MNLKGIFNLFKDRPRQTQSRAVNFKWFPVWEDTDLISRIRFSVYKTNPKFLRTETRVNLQLVEYKTEIEEEVAPQIPLISVSELMQKFEAINPQDLITFSSAGAFKPRIVKIENPIAIIGDALQDYEIQVEQIEKHGLKEAPELREKLEKLKQKETDDVDLLQELHTHLYAIVEENPLIQGDIIFEFGQRRTPTIKQFLGKDYCLLMSHFGQMAFDEEKRKVKGGNLLPIFIPIEGFRMLPFGRMFMGGVLGIAYVYPQPLFRNIGPSFCLVAAAVSVAMPLEMLNK